MTKQYKNKKIRIDNGDIGRNLQNVDVGRLKKMSRQELIRAILVLIRDNNNLSENIDNLRTNLSVFAPQLKGI